MANEKWLPSLKIANAQEGYELAIKLSQKAVQITQPSEKIRMKLRPKYANNANSLIHVSQVIALNFQTVAAANNYWKNKFETRIN